MDQIGEESERRAERRVPKSLVELLLDLFGNTSSVKILTLGVKGLEALLRASGGHKDLVLGHMAGGSMVLCVAGSKD
jgi:hypothetical protein